MPVTITTSLDDSLPKFIAAALLKLKQTGVTRKHVDHVTLPKGSGMTYNEPQIATFSVIKLSQGVDLSQAQEVTDTNIAITHTEAGGQVVITDLAVAALRDPIIRRIGEGLANSYSNYVDNDLTSLFSGLDAGFGTSTSTFAPGWLGAAHSRLLNATRPISGPMVTILQPYHWHDIASDVAALNTGFFRRIVGTPSINDQPGSSVAGLSEDVWRNYIVGHLFGTDVLIDPTISISASASYSATFARDAIIYFDYVAPHMETERDASLRSTELNYSGVYGRGERDGTWGFYSQADATAPTS